MGANRRAEPVSRSWASVSPRSSRRQPAEVSAALGGRLTHSLQSRSQEFLQDEEEAGEVGELLQALQLATRQLPGQGPLPSEDSRPQVSVAEQQLIKLTTALDESCKRESAVERRLKEAHAERQELLSELAKQREERERMVQGLTKAIPSSSHEKLVQQLSYGYRQLETLQQDRLTAQERQRCQAYGQQLVDLEAEVYDRGRELVLARQSAQDLQTIRFLSNLEQKRCSFLERQLDEQAKVYPWLRERQAQMEEYRQLGSIYHDELQAASEIVEALRAESQAWEQRVKEESAASSSRDSPPDGTAAAKEFRHAPGR